jgi:hypothetical protein
MTPGNRHTCGWAVVALIGVVVNLVVLVAAPILRPDLNLFQKSLSYYAIGPWGVLQAIAFAALGISSMALGIALHRTGPASWWRRPTVVLLTVSGVASLALNWYPMGAPGPATILGDAHQMAGTVGGVAQLAAALAFTLAIRTDPAWRGLFMTALTTFLLALLGALLSQAAIWWPHLGIPMGATMRLLVIPLLALWSLVALRLHRSCGKTVPHKKSPLSRRAGRGG